MPELAIDRALAAVRAYQVALEQIVGREKNMPRAQAIRAGIQEVNEALAILEAARAWKAAWGTPAILQAEQDLGRAIRGEQS